MSYIRGSQTARKSTGALWDDEIVSKLKFKTEPTATQKKKKKPRGPTKKVPIEKSDRVTRSSAKTTSSKPAK